VERLFLNADAGFDSNDFRRACDRKGNQCQHTFQ
jgi:hypothetical protein